MKRTIIILSLLISYVFSYSQFPIYDTRTTIDKPSDISQELRLDFKNANTDTPVPQFSTTMTIAPWHDLSGNGSTQLNFSTAGLFFRGSNPDYESWSSWKKIAMLDANGKLDVNGDIVANNLTLNGYVTSDLIIGNESGIGEYGTKLYFGINTCNFDDVYMARYNVAKDVTELRISIGDDALDKFVVGNKHWNNPTAGYQPYFVVTMDGKVGINSPNPTHTLEVNGSIKTKEILVTNTGWADFVFKKDYELRSLQEVETHIEQHQSLPEMPTENEVSANGVDLAKMNVKLLQKIEELTLYIIQQEKRISKLENQNN